MPQVEAGDIKAKSQSRDPDDEVLEWYGDTLGFLLTFDASDHPCHIDSDRMHWNITAQPVDERESTLLVRIRLCAICTMGQLRDRDHREADIDFAVAVLYLFEDLPDCVTSALGGDHNT